MVYALQRARLIYVWAADVVKTPDTVSEVGPHSSLLAVAPLSQLLSSDRGICGLMPVKAFQSMCLNVLGQDSEPQVAPEGIAICGRVYPNCYLPDGQVASYILVSTQQCGFSKVLWSAFRSR